MTYAIRVDSFTSLDDIPKSHEREDHVALALRSCRRFSIFDATRSARMANVLTNLIKSGRLVTDNSTGYPWITVVSIDGHVPQQRLGHSGAKP